MTRLHLAVLCALACLLMPRVSFAEDTHVGLIAFFGQQGIDTVAIRAALPIQEGSRISLGDNDNEVEDTINRLKQGVRDSVHRLIGRDPTDVAGVCCMKSGDMIVYIGLPGKSFHPVHFSKPPNGNIRLSESLLKLDEEIDQLLFNAVLAGKAGEDDSKGYALATDAPELRQKQLEFRDQARMNNDSIFRVVQSSSDARHRAVAATALGYLQRNNRQVSALVDASFDSDGEVRNNAVRALAVLLSAAPEIARQIPAKRFIGLLSSGTWSDRNKGLMVVFRMSQNRDSALLRNLRSEALMPLIEAANWEKGHALSARVILGRIAGIEEANLWPLAEEDPPETILRAVGK